MVDDPCHQLVGRRCEGVVAGLGDCGGDRCAHRLVVPCNRERAAAKNCGEPSGHLITIHQVLALVGQPAQRGHRHSQWQRYPGQVIDPRPEDRPGGRTGPL